MTTVIFICIFANIYRKGMEELNLSMDFFNEKESNELDDLFTQEEEEIEEDDISKKTKSSEAKKPEDVAEEEEDKEVQDDNLDISEMYSSLANLLTEKGLLSTSKEIKTEEDFIEAYKENIKNSEFSDLNDVQKRFLESLRNGLDEETFLRHENNTSILESISVEDLENEENESLRENLIKQNFLIKGLSEDKAVKLTKKIIDSGEDIDEAKEAYEELVKYNKEKIKQEVEAAKESKARAKEAEIKRIEDFKTKVNTTEEVIKGLKVTTPIKNKVIESYTKIAGYTEDGKPYNKIAEAQIKDPADFQFKVAYLFSITDGFKDFSAFQTKKAAQNSAERQLSKILKAGTASLGGNDSIAEETFGELDFKDLDL